MILILNFTIAAMGVAFTVGKALPLINAQSIPKESWAFVTQVSAEDFYKRGLDKAKHKDFEGAIAEFTQAIRLKPNYPKAYYKRALARYQPNEDGEIEGATEDRQKAASLPRKQGIQSFQFVLKSRGCKASPAPSSP